MTRRELIHALMETYKGEELDGSVYVVIGETIYDVTGFEETDGAGSGSVVLTLDKMED